MRKYGTMPFAYVIPDDPNLAGADQRAARGKHDVLGTGPSRRLAKLLPKHVKDNGNAAELSHRLSLWLGTACLGPAEDVKDFALCDIYL